MVDRLNQKPEILQIACYFLRLPNREIGDVLTNLKIQKLCYFAQAIKLSKDNVTLFDDVFEAWSHGPVCRVLYDKFKHFRWQAIDINKYHSVDVSVIAKNDAIILDKVWESLGSLSARTLGNLSHAHQPWRDARGGLPPEVRCQNEITPQAMRQFYTTNKDGKRFVQKILATELN